MLRRPRTKAESDKEAVALAMALCVQLVRRARQYKGENGALPNDSQTVFVRRSTCTIRARPQCSSQREHCSMRWTSVDVAFRGSCSGFDVDSIPSRDIHLEAVVRHDCRA